MITTKQLSINQVLALNNLSGVDMPLNKSNHIDLYMWLPIVIQLYYLYV